ncbi:hypothetical protein BLNAU_1210 [Blattamonas nauphoetae]|uniref:Uncharacterized protein n=1 Tax=Blattamonas nauphoetae TaxID=2049346 RepID=A0ABQ9YIT0_9EUKA|nr:hypothetical protein BLNAU_1210 [Blattamonas nauphoetae]
MKLKESSVLDASCDGRWADPPLKSMKNGTVVTLNTSNDGRQPIIHPHTLPISGNETVIHTLTQIIEKCINLAYPSSLRDLRITTAGDKSNHLEMIRLVALLQGSIAHIR